MEDAIRKAFNGVCLGKGITLKQAQAIDAYGGNITTEEFNALPRSEITEDWESISLAELERNCVAHLDAEGFRYYIPAFMMSVLHHYDASSMRVIGTLSALYTNNILKQYEIDRYSILTNSQKSAIALFLRSLPNITLLNKSDTKVVERALRNYWSQF